MARSREPNPTLYQAVLDHPDDDGPRLAYADWFEENGDPERARFIRLECRLARLPASNSNYNRLQEVAFLLSRRGRKRWLSGRKEDPGVEWHFLRGFPEHVFVHRFQALQDRHADVFRHYVRRLGFADMHSIAEFAASPLLANVPELDMAYCQVGDRAARYLASSPHLGELTWLSLRSNTLTSRGVRALVEANLPQLRYLDLSRSGFVPNHVGPTGAGALADAPWASGLERLLLCGGEIGDEGLRALAESPRLRALAEVDLRNCKLTGAGLAALIAGCAWPRLRSLVLSNNCLGDEGARQLARADHWDHLEALELTRCEIGDAGAAALADAAHFGSLRYLDLSHNLVGERGAWPLGRSTRLPSLREIQLAGNAIREPLAVALTRSFAQRNTSALDELERTPPATIVEPEPEPATLPVGKGSADENGLLLAIADDPDDDVPLMVYADWLDDNGDPQWAELIRLDLRTGGSADADRRVQLSEAILARRLKPFARHVKGGAIERGLLCVHVPVRSFLSQAFQANAVAWFQEARVQGLHLTGSTQDWRGVANSSVLGAVRELSLSGEALTERGVRAVFDSPHLPGLNTLQLSNCPLIEEALGAMTRASLARLRRLFLPNNRMGNTELTALLAWHQVARLTTLALAHNQLGPAEAAWLANAAPLAGLRRLDLSYNTLHGPGVLTLAGSPHLAGLTHLYLRGVGLEPAGTVNLVATARLSRLAVLDLDNNALRDEGAIALAEAPTLAGTRLILTDCNVTQRCQRELRKRHGDRVRFG